MNDLARALPACAGSAGRRRGSGIDGIYSGQMTAAGTPGDAGAPAASSGSDELQVVCGYCGATGLGPPLSWSFESDPRRGIVYYCTDCSRNYLRAIESKLSAEWW